MNNNLLLGLSKIRVGKLTKRDVVVSPPVTKNLWHYVEIGQSQSLGVKTVPYHSESGNTNSRVKMLGATPVLEYINGNTDLAGDQATLNSQLLNTCTEGFYDYATIGSDQFVESGSVLFGRQLLSYLDALYSDTLSNVVVTKSSRGAQTLQKLDKGGTSGCFERAMYAIERVKALAEAQGFIYNVVVGVRHGGTVNDNYDLDVQEIIDNLRTDILAIAGITPTIFFEQTRQLATVTPEASEAMARIVSQNNGVYITNPRYAVEYGGDNIHQTTDGQIHSMMYMAYAIKSVILDNNQSWQPFFAGDPIFSEPNGVPTITMGLFGVDGTIEGSGDYGINIYNETLAQWVSRNDYTVSVVNDSIRIEFSSIGSGQTLNVWTNYEDVVPPFNSFSNNFADDATLGFLRTVYTGPSVLFSPDDSSPTAPYDPTSEYPLDMYILRRKYTVQTTNTVPALQDIIISNIARATIRIQTDRTLDATSLTDVSAFALGGTIAVAKTIIGRSISGSDFILTVDSDFAEADAPTITYVVPGSNPIKDTLGNALGGFTDYIVNNTIAGDTPSTYVSNADSELQYNGTNYYGFTAWPYPSNIIAWKEYHPVGFDTEEKYPAIIDVHGIGTNQPNEGLGRYIDLGNELEGVGGEKFMGFPVYGGFWVQPDAQCNIIEYVFNHPNVDKARIYLTGLSGGAMHANKVLGFNTWDGYLVEPFADKLAGVCSMAGSVVNGWSAALLSRKPWLIKHNEGDATIPPNNIVAIYDSIQSAKAILNVFAGGSHNVWDATWNDSNSGSTLITWNGVPSDPFKSIWTWFNENTNADTVPSPISDLSAIGTGTQEISVAWSLPYDGGQPVIEMELQRSLETPTSWSTIASISGTELTAGSAQFVDSDPSLVENTSYKYQIRRTNSLGTSAWSNITIGSTQAAGASGQIMINHGSTVITNYNLVGRYAATVSNMVNIAGSQTGVSIQKHDSSGGMYTTGQINTDGAGSKVYADIAAQECYRIADATVERFTVSGLDPAASYEFRFYSSYAAGGDRSTLFKVWTGALGTQTGLQSATVDGRNAFNEADYELVFTVTPNAGGEVFFSYELSLGLGVFNAMRIIQL